MNAPLPGPLNDNPSLDRWVAFPSAGKVTVLTGRVELGQGVLTAMAQIAADELDVAMERITIRSGDTEMAPNEGYTAGSQSMQFGGVALRQALAEVRALFLDQAAKVLACKASELSIRDGSIYRNGKSTGQDYWTLSGAVDLAIKATGAAARKPIGDLKTIGASSARLDLPAKVFGDSVFIHDMQIDGMVHARVVRQPNRGATIGSIDENAIRRAAKGPIEFVRNGNFLAILGDNETAVEAAGAAAVNNVIWQNVEAPTPTQQEANWLLQRPAVDRPFGAEPADAKGRERFERTYTRGYLAHASISPSCGLALYKDGQLTVWTHCQGVYPLRAALAKTLKLEPTSIVVHHVQGSGCYGHNGADDAAADAAIIAMQKPGQPIRVRWRREEEFIYEPKTPAMIVKVRALLDEAGKPIRLDAGNLESHAQSASRRWRKFARRPRLARSAAGTAAERRAGGQWRRRDPQWRAALQYSHQTHAPSSGDRSARAHFGAARPWCDVQRIRSRVLHRRTCRACRTGSRAISPLDHLRCARPRRDREGCRHGEMEGGLCRRHRPRPWHCFRPLQEPRRLFRRGRRAFGRRGNHLAPRLVRDRCRFGHQS